MVDNGKSNQNGTMNDWFIMENPIKMIKNRWFRGRPILGNLLFGVRCLSLPWPLFGSFWRWNHSQSSLKLVWLWSGKPFQISLMFDSAINFHEQKEGRSREFSSKMAWHGRDLIEPRTIGMLTDAHWFKTSEKALTKGQLTRWFLASAPIPVTSS